MSIVRCIRGDHDFDSDLIVIEELDGELVCERCYVEEMERRDEGK